MPVPGRLWGPQKLLHDLRPAQHLFRERAGLKLTYRIRDWNLHYENNRTRDLKRLDWVPIPNRMDGDGYTQLLKHRHGASHFGAWIALVEIASRCDVRGVLTRHNGEPHSPSTLARVSLISVDVMSTALLRLVDIGWIETYDDSTGNSVKQNNIVIDKIPHPPAEMSHPPAEECLRARGNGREWKGMEETPIPPYSPDGERVPDVLDFALAPPGAVLVNGTLSKYQGDWFEQWWAIYWRKVSRKHAEKAFRTHCKTPERFEEIMQATKIQTATMMARDPDHRPHGATWLNAERWKDERSQPARAVPQQAKGFVANVERVIGERLARGDKPW